MREGHAFLDEKCLLLADAMLSGLRRREQIGREFEIALAVARAALAGALARHGIEGLQCLPAPAPGAEAIVLERSALLGVPLRQADLPVGPKAEAAPVFGSPEASACRDAYATLARLCVRLAALTGNLARLDREYRRTLRRAQALHDVLLPEIEGSIARIEEHLEDLERDEALWVRRGGGSR